MGIRGKGKGHRGGSRGEEKWGKRGGNGQGKGGKLREKWEISLTATEKNGEN